MFDFLVAGLSLASALDVVALLVGAADNLGFFAGTATPTDCKPNLCLKLEAFDN